MKIINKTDFPDWMLRRMISWCAKELDFPVRQLALAEFKNTRRRSGDSLYVAWGGFARWRDARANYKRSINVRIAPNNDPFPRLTIKHHGGLQESIADRVEALVKVTAHEIAHHEQHRRKTNTRRYNRRGGSERSTNQLAFRCLRLFREQRDKLLMEWFESKSNPVENSVSIG